MTLKEPIVQISISRYLRLMAKDIGINDSYIVKTPLNKVYLTDDKEVCFYEDDEITGTMDADFEGCIVTPVIKDVAKYLNINKREVKPLKVILKELKEKYS